MDNFLGLPVSGFLKDVLRLSLGTVISRSVYFISLPLVMHLYTPQDFTTLAVYMSIVSIVASIACFRFEIAIPLASNDTDAVNLLGLSLFFLLLNVLFTLLLSILIPGLVADWIGSPTIESYLFLVPFGIAVIGAYSATQFWATRAHRFGKIASTRISQSIIGVLTQLSFGWAGASPLGLILGNVLASGAGVFSLARQMLILDQAKINTVTLANMKLAMYKYYRYPVFSAPETILNVAGLQIPILLIASSGGGEAGILLIAIQVMSVPMILLGSSISQVYISRASKEFSDGKLSSFTFSIMYRLTTTGTGPILILGALIPFISPYFFKGEWLKVGEISSLIVPWIIIQFITSPVSMAMHITGRQKSMLLLTVIGFFLRAGSVLIALKYEGATPVFALAISSALYYLIVGCFVFYAVELKFKNFIKLISVIFNWKVLFPLILFFIEL